MKEVADNTEDKILITDHIGYRGAEFEKVIISINPNEYFLKQYIIESLTRCTNDLSFIIIPKKTLLRRNELTSSNIFQRWLDEKIVEKRIVTICSSHKEIDRMGDYCESNGNYQIHLWEFKETSHLTSSVTSDTINVIDCYRRFLGKYNIICRIGSKSAC